MATIKEVAREAGTSVATISRVMNTPGLVAEGTRERVYAAMEVLGYSATGAPGRRVQASRTLMVVLPGFGNPFFGDILDGMNDAALRYGYTLLITATNSIVERERETVRRLDRHQADGIAFLSPLLSEAEMRALDMRFPLVQCCEYLNTEALSHVSIDNYSACAQVMEHLIRLGHRRIAMISSNNSFVSTREREHAYGDTLDRAGLSGYHRILRGSYSFENGYTCAQRLLSASVKPTALLAISDTVAAGAMRTIHEAGLRVPEDIAVAGFDNVDMSQMLAPTLTTVAQPRNRLGTTAIEMLINRLNGSDERQKLTLPHELLLRQSTNAPAPAQAAARTE